MPSYKDDVCYSEPIDEGAAKVKESSHSIVSNAIFPETTTGGPTRLLVEVAMFGNEKVFC